MTAAGDSVHRPLLVSHTAESGGSNAVLLALLRHRPEGVVPACVFLNPGPVVEQVRAMGVPAVLVPVGRTRDLRRWAGVVRTLRRAIRRHRADLVFGHTAKAQLFGGAAAALERVPAIWWQHALPGQEPLAKIADRVPAEMIIVSAEWTATRQRERTPRRDVKVVHPGIDLPACVEAPVSAAPVVGIVGRLQRWKRVELLLDAAPAVLREVPAARFEILGGGDPAIDPEYPSELERRAAALGISAAVRFRGHVDDAAEAMRDFAVLAHTADHEPFGLVYIEALARGVPVVGPDHGGSLEIVRDGVDGLLVDVTDPDRLARALIDLLRDPERRAAMGAAGRASVAERFRVERMADQTWRLALRAPGSSPPRS